MGSASLPFGGASTGEIFRLFRVFYVKGKGIYFSLFFFLCLPVISIPVIKVFLQQQ